MKVDMRLTDGDGTVFDFSQEYSTYPVNMSPFLLEKMLRDFVARAVKHLSEPEPDNGTS